GPGLVVVGGVGRVEVLAAAPAERPGAAPGRVASQVVYRDHPPPPEVVVEPAAPSPSGQAGLDHDPVGDPRRPQLLDERVPRLRGPAQLVLLRSEEQTSELQSRENLVCHLLIAKK